MLTTLRISGFAIVDQVEVRFGPGLNVLTGETGAGKSILLEALHLVLGGRMSADVLRDGVDEASVEALFELGQGHPVLERLASAGLLSANSGEIVVRRTASRSGRGRAFVNGSLCTVGMLESCLPGLLDMTGQHEHVALLDEGTHVALLDAYAAGRASRASKGEESPTRAQVDGEGGPPTRSLRSLLDRYRAAFARWSEVLRERARLEGVREEQARHADYLGYQLRELEAARPAPGEDAALERERHVLAAAEKLREAAQRAEELAFGEEGGAAERLGRAVRALDDAAELDVRLGPALALLRSAVAEAEEAGRVLAHYAESVGGDPDRLAEIEDRLEVLRGLARKHGGSLEAALERAESMRAELGAVQGCGERLARLEAEAGEAGAHTLELARELSRARAQAARAFCRDVQRELEVLAMARCRVEVAFLPPEHALTHEGTALGQEGAERAQILLAPNSGEAPRPLARIASGGELSRVLLAAKRALSRADPIDTYVFDEVDSGIGGGVAEAVGRLLWEVAHDRQVICVTHLPQVAAFADHHAKVLKRVVAGRTVTAVEPLRTLDERQAEVARMLAGSTVTCAALEHAKELIAGVRGGSVLPAASERRRPRARIAARRAAGARGSGT